MPLVFFLSLTDTLENSAQNAILTAFCERSETMIRTSMVRYEDQKLQITSFKIDVIRIYVSDYVDSGTM